MKAAVLHELGQIPRYEDFPEPVARTEEQMVITMKAASVKNLDKGRASGQHYASHGQLPAVVGIDGVGVLADGMRVYANGLTGTLAEKALIGKSRFIALPDNIDDATAAALPNAVLGSALGLRYRAGIKPGDTIFINGATGVTGRVAIQIAKHYGAKKIIASGRNPESLKTLINLGADEIVSLQQNDADFIHAIETTHNETPIDIVMDYTWGHPAEMILTALRGSGLHAKSQRVRFVTVGAMAGDSIQLPSAILRSAPIEILGSGFGSISEEGMKKFQTDILPDMFQLAADGLLKIDTVTTALPDIETTWQQALPSGKRLVVLI